MSPAGRSLPTGWFIARMAGCTASLVGGANDVGTLYRLTMPGPARLDRRTRSSGATRWQLSSEDRRTAPPTRRPPAAGQFGDVACPGLFADWIEVARRRGHHGRLRPGGNYCPLSHGARAERGGLSAEDRTRPRLTRLRRARGSSPMSPAHTSSPRGSSNSSPRESPAVAVAGSVRPAGYPRADGRLPLKLEHGGSYEPPACQPQFADVICPSLFASWIDQLYEEQITAACAGPP